MILKGKSYYSIAKSLDSVQVPYYNYEGDFILGYKSHMGAGFIASNVRILCRSRK